MPKRLGPKGDPCPHCGRPMPIGRLEERRRYYAAHRSELLAYSRRYYLEVTKPRNEARKRERDMEAVGV